MIDHKTIKRFITIALFVVIMMSTVMSTADASTVKSVKSAQPTTVILMGKPKYKFNGKDSFKFLCKKTGLTQDSHKLIKDAHYIAHHWLDI